MSIRCHNELCRGFLQCQESNWPCCFQSWIWWWVGAWMIAPAAGKWSRGGSCARHIGTELNRCRRRYTPSRMDCATEAWQRQWTRQAKLSMVGPPRGAYKEQGVGIISKTLSAFPAAAAMTEQRFPAFAQAVDVLENMSIQGWYSGADGAFWRPQFLPRSYTGREGYKAMTKRVSTIASDPVVEEIVALLVAASARASDQVLVPPPGSNPSSEHCLCSDVERLPDNIQQWARSPAGLRRSDIAHASALGLACGFWCWHPYWDELPPFSPHFKHVLFSPLFVEDFQFDNIFRMGWNHHLDFWMVPFSGYFGHVRGCKFQGCISYAS